MNIALSAVIISILLIPPVVFYLSLFIGRFSRAIPKFSLFEGILGTAVISLLIHAVAILFIHAEIRFDILIKLLGGDLKDMEKTVTNTVVKDAVTDFALYNLILLAVMVILGRITRLILLATGLHQRNQVFNLYHKWWYFFNGAVTDLGDYDVVFVDAVVDTKDGTMIYSGFLVSFETEGSALDRIYLKDVIRREFKRPAEGQPAHLINEPGSSLEVPTGTFALKYSNIINLSLNFIVIEDEQEFVEDDMPIL